MPSNFCMRCGGKFRGQGRFCPEHAASAEAQRTRDRYVLEPWRRYYDMPEWDKAQKAARRRDSNQCRARLQNGRRCSATEGIHVHHRKPLRGGGAPFELDNLITLCKRHHDEADRAYRQRREPVFV